MAGIAYQPGIRIVHKPGLGVAVCGMPSVTADAGAGIRIRSLPARQEAVEVIVPIPLGGYVLMALAATIIADRPGQLRRLDSRPRIKCQGIVCTEQFSLNAPGHPFTGMTIDTAGIICFMGRSQIHGLGIHRALEEG